MMDTEVVEGASLIGRLEFINEQYLGGWAWDSAREAPARLKVTIDGTWSAEVTPSMPRPDLAAIGIQGACGFHLRLPSEYMDLRPHHLTVVAVDSGDVLHDDPRAALTTDASYLYRLWRLGVALRHGMWSVAEYGRVDGMVVGTAWAVPPRAVDVPFQLKVNGVVAETARLDSRDPGVTHLVGVDGLYDAPYFTFRVPEAALGETAVLHFSYCDSQGQPFSAAHDLWFDSAEVPVPPDHLRVRVHGPGTAESFQRVGAHVAHAVRTALARHFPGGLGGFGTVLDWGCGCARPTRYMQRWVGGRLIGVDPDGEAIEWCRANLPGAMFLRSGFHPPLPFADASLDCVCGISVLTHLSEPDQDLWLAELARVLRPGGALLLTVFGNTAWARMRRPAEEFLAWQKRGFADFGATPDLAGVLEAEAYRAISHDEGYIRTRWTRDFSLLEFADGGIGGWQDIVVLRRRN